ICCWTFPTFFSALPSVLKLRLPVALPTSSLIVPFTSWKLPLIWSFVLVFIFLLRPCKARIAFPLSHFEGCHFFNLVAFQGLSKIDHRWNGPRLHPEKRLGYTQRCHGK